MAFCTFFCDRLRHYFFLVSFIAVACNCFLRRSPSFGPLLPLLSFSNLGSFFARVKAAIIHACLSDLSSVASIAIRVWYGVRFQNSTGLIPARTALLYDVASQSGSAFFLPRHLPAHSCRQSTPIAKPVARRLQRVSMEAITP